MCFRVSFSSSPNRNQAAKVFSSSLIDPKKDRKTVKTASVYKNLWDGDKQFLSAIAKEVATLADVSNNMNHFQKQLTEFSDKWKAYKTAQEADRKGKWQPSMGRPKNPLGTIWPLIYGSGWRDGV